LFARPIKSNFEELFETRTNKSFSIKICHDTLLITTNHFIYITKFSLSEESIDFEVCLKLDVFKFSVRDTIDVNFLQLQKVQ